jgi:hypothetical protein
MRKDKVAFNTKKDAETKLNFLSESSSLKKIPVRCYEEDGKWFITSHPGNKPVSLKVMIDAVLKDSASRRRETFSSKSEMEEDERLRNFISKQLKIFYAKNNS